MSKKLLYLSPLLIPLSLFVLVLPSYATEDKSNAKAIDKRVREQIIEIIKSEFVDPVGDDKFSNPDLAAMIKDIDPHGRYIDKGKSQPSSSTPNDLYWTKVGIRVARQNHQLKILYVGNNSDAARAGLRSGHLIVKVAGVPEKDVSAKALHDLIWHKHGPSFNVTVLNTLTQQQEEIAINPNPLRDQTIYWSEPQAGFVQIWVSEFGLKTIPDLIQTLEQYFNNSPPKGLILDLRDNFGGVINSALAFAGVFLPEKSLITSLHSKRDGNIPKKIFSSDKYIFKEDERRILEERNYMAINYLSIPLVIIVNKKSTSGTELAAAALQDYQRATIVGTPTPGDNSIQTVQLLRNGSLLQLTTSKWSTPKNRMLDKTGLTPDILAKDEIEKIPRDTQLERALLVLKSKIPIEHAENK